MTTAVTKQKYNIFRISHFSTLPVLNNEKWVTHRKGSSIARGDY